MTQSIMAGLMIAIAAGMYLKVGGAVGACLFAIGLLTILFFKFHLFTGKAGLLVEKKISGQGLMKVYVGNLIGCYIGTFILAVAGLPIFEAGAAVIALLCTTIGNILGTNTISLAIRKDHP